MQKSILITIDVEDWFQVENFKPWIPFSSWPDRELRVEQNVHSLLDIFDSITAHTSTNPVRATFFILGWIADRLPHMVREIIKRGHEVASHGLDHDLPTKLPGKVLLNDLTGSRKCLEDIIGAPVLGYRAPSFSIDDTILDLIQEAGYLYDSSYNSFSLHGRYGKIHLNGGGQTPWAVRIADGFYEIPVSNVTLFRKVLPLGGGGYFRLFPTPLFNAGVRRVLNANSVFVFYMHPWEVDPEQPRVSAASRKYRFRHYVNIHKTRDRLTGLIQRFSHAAFLTCADALSRNGQN